MCKLLLTIIGQVLARVVFEDNAMQPHDQGGPEGNPGMVQNPANHRSPLALRRAVDIVFNQRVELMMRNVSIKLANHIAEQVIIIINLFFDFGIECPKCWIGPAIRRYSPPFKITVGIISSWRNVCGNPAFHICVRKPKDHAYT